MRRFQNVEDVVWKAYIRALAPWFGVRLNDSRSTLGKNTSLLVCPPTQQGIAAGTWVPRQVTNNQIYQIADSLLPCDSPIFLPEGSSYFRALRSYIAYVKLGTGKVSPKNQRRLNSAQSDSISTNFEYEEQKESALGILMNQPDNTLPFESWALRNAPSYITARRSMREAEARLLQVQQEINGNIASIYSEDYKNLALAASRSPQPGLNMPCITEDINTIQRDRHNAEMGIANQPAMTLDGIFYRPNYSLENYQTLVEDWVSSSSFRKPIELKLDLKGARDSSWSNYGFDEKEAENNLQSWPLMTTSDGSGECTNKEELDFSKPGSNIDIKISYRGLKLLNIASGIWDIPGVRRRYPNLCEGAPPDLIPSLVKPEKLLVGYGPGLEITLDAENFESTAGLIHDARDARGRVSLFGFDIRSNDIEGAHTVPFEHLTADNRAYKISIPGTNDTCPVLVGVLARKL